MSSPLDYAGPQSSFTLHPQSRWTALSVAAVGCCGLFVTLAVLAGLIHPQIPVALIVMIAGCPIVAVALGMAAQRSAAGPARGARGAAIFGAIVLLLVVGTALLLPTLCRSSEQANRVKCASNLRQIGMAMDDYAKTHGGKFPPDLQTLARDSDLTSVAFVCPSSSDIPANINKPSDWAEAFKPDSHELSYVYVAGGLGPSDVNDQSVLAYENPHNHLDEGMNILFGDFHVEWFPTKAAAEIIAAHPPGRAATTQDVVKSRAD